MILPTLPGFWCWLAVQFGITDVREIREIEKSDPVARDFWAPNNRFFTAAVSAGSGVSAARDPCARAGAAAPVREAAARRRDACGPPWPAPSAPTVGLPPDGFPCTRSRPAGTQPPGRARRERGRQGEEQPWRDVASARSIEGLQEGEGRLYVSGSSGLSGETFLHVSRLKRFETVQDPRCHGCRGRGGSRATWYVASLGETRP